MSQEPLEVKYPEKVKFLDYFRREKTSVQYHLHVYTKHGALGRVNIWDLRGDELLKKFRKGGDVQPGPALKDSNIMSCGVSKMTKCPS